MVHHVNDSSVGYRKKREELCDFLQLVVSICNLTRLRTPKHPIIDTYFRLSLRAIGILHRQS